MKLILLNNLNDIKAFVKLEDGCRGTIAFSGSDGKFMWFIDNKISDISKKHSYFHYTAPPKQIGIFLIDGDKAFLASYLGDCNFIKSNFKKISGYDVVDALEKSETIEIIKEKEDAYKKTDYTLPDDFLSPPETTPNTFWDCNKKTFDDAFSKNPENTCLSELIPGSKWVNILEDNYVLGIISDEEDLPLYICYGFPMPWSEEPPEKLEGYCQWIPIDFSHPHEEGYWVIYINAKTGERIS